MQPRWGLGVYATEDIEYAQELLIVNREYPTKMVEESQVAAPGPDTPNISRADAGATAAVRDEENLDTLPEAEAEGSQYATFNEWGG